MEGTSRSTISFGFKKKEKPNILKSNTENIKEVKKYELIDSIEGSSLKVIGKDPNDYVKKQLVIPITDDQKTRPISKLIQARRDMRSGKSTKLTEEPPENETLEQKAAREIIEDLKNASIKPETKVLELPIHPDELPLNGAVESTIDDYEKIPIADFGKALLRGMGWKEEEKKEDAQKLDFPVVRPKGLGLGADKVVKKQKLLVQPAANETLEIKRNACVKILAGKHINLYGTIEGFDDGGGRLIVKLAIGGLKVLMNEFMVQPVPKQEFAKYSKILNSEKFEDEKKNPSSANVKEERRSRSLSPPTSRGRDDSSKSYKSRGESSSYRSREDYSSSRGREERRRNESEERGRPKSSNYPKKDTRNYSSDSEDDKTNNRKYNERHRSRSHDRHRRRYSSSGSSDGRYRSKKKSSKKSSKSKSKMQESPDMHYSSDDERKHKRKYKKSKHHRDRS